MALIVCAAAADGRARYRGTSFIIPRAVFQRLFITHLPGFLPKTRQEFKMIIVYHRSVVAALLASWTILFHFPTASVSGKGRIWREKPKSRILLRG
jgi:hypothetical protein